MARDTSSNITRGAAVTLTIDGKMVNAFAGETLATVVIANGQLHFNRTGGNVQRGAFCNMGTCLECQLRVALPPAQPYRWLRACMVTVNEGMSVLTDQSRQIVSSDPHEN